jgi:hypothetical protein
LVGFCDGDGGGGRRDDDDDDGCGGNDKSLICIRTLLTKLNKYALLKKVSVTGRMVGRWLIVR